MLRRFLLLRSVLRGRAVLPVSAGVLFRQRRVLRRGGDVPGEWLCVGAGSMRGRRRCLHDRGRLLRAECLFRWGLRGRVSVWLPGLRWGLLSGRVLR